MHSHTSQNAFFHQFIAEMHADGLTARQIARTLWQPHQLDTLALFGDQRDQDLDHLAVSEEQIRALLADGNQGHQPLAADYCSNSSLALILVPGFSHETLRHFSWHEIIDQPQPDHHCIVLHPATDNSGVREEVRSQGSGLTLAYLRYPRSNADSRHSVPAMFEMLHNSATVQQWVKDGRKLVFVGYSNGAPLSLELLAGLHSGRFADSWLLDNTAAFISLCGDIGGSYLADDVTAEKPRFIDIPALVARCKRYPLLGKLIGLGSEQLQNDMVDGVRALGHSVRQQKLANTLPALPPQLHYLSLGAVLPMADYRRKLWHFNLDDYSMWKQSQITNPITLYHDGQVALPDAVLPRPDHLPPNRHHYLGAVRAHHWAVSYRTFNQGRSRFPRQALYRALLGTLEGVISK